MKLTRRTAVVADTVFAREAHHRAYHDVVVDQFGSWDEVSQDKFFEADWENGQFEILLCDDFPCGYVSIEDQPDGIHIRELVVLPEFQRRGIGSSVIRDAIERAKLRGVAVKLETLHKNRALYLYKKLGFQECASTETHTLMQWNSSSLPAI
jgi:ribosomal protein S18 acetylase RimI-like enzyme